MTHHTDEERRRIAAAMKYMDDPNSEPFSAEGLDHMQHFLDDIKRRAKMAAIMSGKRIVQESIGEEPSFDFFYQSHSVLQRAHFAEAIAFLIKSMTEQNAESISLNDLKHIYAEIILEVVGKHKDLEDFESSIRHIVLYHAKKNKA